MRDWDDALDNRGHVAGSDALPALWTARAAATRAMLGTAVETLRYGEADRAVLDLVWPERDPAGLVVFVHGGYWMRLDKSFWTDLAEGARAAGWAVAIPSYTLAPQARIGDITRQIAVAIRCAAGRVGGPIRLAGHSAGGQLVSRMLADDQLLGAEVSARVVQTLSISGLYDLRPLLRTRMNETLGLTPEEADAESPVLRRPLGSPRLVCWVGANERPEFLRQAELMALMWDGLEARTSLVVEPGMNHFTVIDGLRTPGSPIVRALLETT